MWKDYIKERENLDTYENEKGFLTYEINHGVCFMSDIYVKPEYRNTSAAFKLYMAVKNIAIDEGCTGIRGQVDRSLPGWEKSLQLMERLGFIPYSNIDTLTYLQLKLYTVRGT
jgi:GNAT superfamily N-acetyltransferase